MGLVFSLRNSTLSLILSLGYLWLPANQSAIYKGSRKVDLGTTIIKFNELLERVLNLGSPDLMESALTYSKLRSDVLGKLLAGSEPSRHSSLRPKSLLPLI